MCHRPEEDGDMRKDTRTFELQLMIKFFVSKASVACLSTSSFLTVSFVFMSSVPSDTGYFPVFVIPASTEARMVVVHNLKWPQAVRFHGDGPSEATWILR